MVETELEMGPPTPQLHLMHAKISLLFEKNGEAYQSIVRALELDPAHQEAIQLKSQREAEARKLQDQAVKFLLLGQRDGALNKISTAIECDPRPAEFHILRGAIHRQSGQYVRAVDELLTAVDKCKEEERERGSTYSAACRQLVLTYNDFAIQCFKREKYDEAVQLLNKALEEEKKEAGLYVNRGDCFYRLSNLHFALGDYCRAQHLSPGDWQIRCRVAVTQSELGVKEFTSGHFKEAEKLFSSAITNNPKVSRFYFYRARTRYELKMTGATRQDLLQLLVLEPECDAALPLIARVFPGKTRSDLLDSCAMATTSTGISATSDGNCGEFVNKRESLAEKRQRELEELFLQLGLVEGERGEREPAVTSPAVVKKRIS
jgi:tetratricopeptide (TPR) repeat protein